MKRRHWLLLAASHAAIGAAGFGAGIYVLPILVAPEGPSAEDLGAVERAAVLRGRFRRELAGSDSLHWGEGELTLGTGAISLRGRLAPGPDYKLYLSPEFVENEAQFERVKPRMVRAGDVKTFDGFVVPVPPDIDPANHRAVIIWCERFREFITAAEYR